MHMHVYSLRLQVDKVLCPQQHPPIAMVQHRSLLISNSGLPDSAEYPWVCGDDT